MNPIQFALRHPITVMVGVAAILFGSLFAATRLKVDVFPSLNMPVIVVSQPYGGMSARQMEGLLSTYYEFHFLYVNGIDHVESKNIQSTALLKLYFHPGTDMAQAMSETVAAVNRARFMMPPGTVPPFVARVDTDTAAIGYLVLSSEKRTITEIQDIATLRVRPMFANIDGLSSPPAFGGNQRAVVVAVDPDMMRKLNLTPEDVTNAVSAGNAVSPSGNVRIDDRMFLVNTNAMVGKNAKEELGDIPVRMGPNPIFLKDIADIDDKSSDIPSGYVLVDGRRSNYILINKRSNASTIDVVNRLKAELQALRESVPEDVKIEFVFDQSPIVTSAMGSVAAEGLLGAVLTGVMVLLFLRDWRTVIVVVLNIPLAILAAVIGLWLAGQTINIMSLGGLALAVGILVDESTVEVENIHTQMEHTASVPEAVRKGNAETAVPRLLALLCIIAVFLPSFFMEGSAKALFMPLSLAVGFAMIASYILSSTFVPVVSVWLLRHAKKHPESHPGQSSFYRRLVGAAVGGRWLFVPLYLGLAGVALFLLVRQLGVDIFPRSDNGQFLLRIKAPTGTRIERTEVILQEALRLVKEEVGEDNIQMTVGFVGMIPSNYPVQYLYQWTAGPEEAFVKIALKPSATKDLAAVKEKLRAALPKKIGEFLQVDWRRDGLGEAEIRSRLDSLKFSFEPADIINEVMSFGAPMPVEVVVSGQKVEDNLAYAAKVQAEMAKIPPLRDLQMLQAQDYPTINVEIDRRKAALSNLSAENVSNALIPATASSRYMKPIYWRDPASGQAYIIQVQVPISRMSSVSELEQTVVRGNGLPQHVSASDGRDHSAVLLRDVAALKETTMPGEIDRYNMRRYVSLAANTSGEDLGRVRTAIDKAIKAAGAPPRGVRLEVRGQLQPLRQIVRGLSVGLAVAVLVIFLLLTSYFQSAVLGLISVTAIPAALTGVAAMLLATGNTLNLQSFMGAIMVMGVATANAILLVTFAERARRDNGGDAVAAAIAGAGSRLRPIVMTSCAMLVGMLPMGIGFGEGGDQAKPLGLAVIGGLLASTAATLLILPAIFALLRGRSTTASASLDPYDAESRYFVSATVRGADHGHV